MRVLIVCLMLGVSAAATAAEYSIDPNSFAPGTNVSRRIPGVVLGVETVPLMPFTHSVYEPTFTPLIANSCLSSDLCPNPSGKRKFGDAFYEGRAAHVCYTGTFIPPVVVPCSVARTVVLRAVFYGGLADFVSFNTSWWSDAPVLFAYDRFGDVVAECHTPTTGVTDDCDRVTIGDLRTGYRTKISLRRSVADVYSVIVAGSYSSVRIGVIQVSIP